MPYEQLVTPARQVSRDHTYQRLKSMKSPEVKGDAAFDHLAEHGNDANDDPRKISQQKLLNPEVMKRPDVQHIEGQAPNAGNISLPRYCNCSDQRDGLCGHTETPKTNPEDSGNVKLRPEYCNNAIRGECMSNGPTDTAITVEASKGHPMDGVFLALDDIVQCEFDDGVYESMPLDSIDGIYISIPDSPCRQLQFQKSIATYMSIEGQIDEVDEDKLTPEEPIDGPPPERDYLQILPYEQSQLMNDTQG